MRTIIRFRHFLTNISQLSTHKSGKLQDFGSGPCDFYDGLERTVLEHSEQVQFGVCRTYASASNILMVTVNMRK